MKKITLSLLVILMAFAAVVSLTGCGPTAGLDEISFDDIASAKLYDTYGSTTKTVTYASDGSASSTKSDETEMSGAAVKIAIAASKAAIETVKIVYTKSSGKVCANKDYSKIVTYAYTRDSEGKLVSEVIVTYKKK